MMKFNRQKMEAETDEELQEQPKQLDSDQQTDAQVIYGLDQEGNSIQLEIVLNHNETAELTICVRLSNGYVYKLPNEPEVLLCSVPTKKWRAAGLTLTVIEPYRRLRIAYNGFLRYGLQSELNEKAGRVAHVKFNFVWNAADKPLHYSRNASNILPWKRRETENGLREDGYSQYGVLQGLLSGEAFPQDWALHLASFRKHYWGMAEESKLRQKRCIFVVAEDGTLFNIESALYKKNSVQQWCGTMLDNLANIHRVHQYNMETMSAESISDTMILSFKAKKRKFKCKINIDHKSVSTTCSNADKGWKLTTTTGICKLGIQNGCALILFKRFNQGSGIIGAETAVALGAQAPKENLLWVLRTQSNFVMYVYDRCGNKLHCCTEDSTALKVWLNRSHNKWISHDVINEILDILADNVRENILDKIRNNMFAIIADETTDLSEKEQLSPFTDAQTLYKVERGGRQSTQSNFEKPAPMSGIALPQPLLKEPSMDTIQYVFTARLTSRPCRVASIAGGKGSSLALASSLKSGNFLVPEGFVVLYLAFDYQLDQNEKLRKAVGEIEDITRGKIEKDLAEACQEAAALFPTQPIHHEIVKAISKELMIIAGGDPVWRWAVRSSGLTEDSEELSCAGQNETILGCRTESDILQAIARCWGSLFTFRSVQYRRQHGLEVNSSMAVVIQRMVSADSAGVLFSRHPLTGDPSKIVITSNYGLGESVVSGRADPDTFYLNRTWLDEVTLHSKEVGSKKVHIQMPLNNNESTGTESVETDLNLAKTLSLTDEQALAIAHVGIELERAFGSPQDVEWALFENQLYLLQSRSITTFNTWTDFELLHEFDTPVLTNQELLTIANLAEVMPGALTPLSNSTINRIMGDNVYRSIMKTKELPFVQKITGSSHHHAIMNVINSFFIHTDNRITLPMKVADVAVFGHPVVNEEIHAIAKCRFGVTSKFGQLRVLLQQIKNASRSGEYVDLTTKLVSSLNLKFEENLSAVDMLHVINKSFLEIGKLCKYHERVSENNVFYQVIAMYILASGSDDLAMDHYYDISLLLSSCSNVISAEVPKILENISHTIQEEGITQNFLKVNSRDGMNWLRLNCLKASKQVDLFLEEYGHRSFREFELKGKSWDTDPSVVIEMLQANCKSTNSNKSSAQLNAHDTVAKLVTPRSDSIRRILKVVLKKCRTSVTHREKTKSEIVRAINKTRIAFSQLAKQMIFEGIIPDPELIYYFSFPELKQLIEKRQTNLVQKAMKRQRLYPQWDKLKLPELMFGVPRLEEDDSGISKLRKGESSIRLTGTPVCLGDVAGRACVISDLENIGTLQSGDILITYGTDIGWSAYFPLLSAVVTELGGIISHGAVVAREYGLPCIVGVQNAMSVFKTGDQVFLSAKSGIIELIKPNSEC